jgi:hypothetical protein
MLQNMHAERRKDEDWKNSSKKGSRYRKMKKIQKPKATLRTPKNHRITRELTRRSPKDAILEQSLVNQYAICTKCSMARLLWLSVRPVNQSFTLL